MTPARSPCEETRWALWPDPEAPAPADARAHYERCPECRHFFARDRELAARLGRLAGTAVPGSVRARVLHGLAPARRRVPAAWRVTAGALAVAATLVLVVLTRGDGMERMIAPLAAEARAAELVGLAVSSPDAAVVGGWLAGALGSAVLVPAITDAELVGGRVAMIGGRPAAVVLYRMHGDPLSYFAMPEDAMNGGLHPERIVVAQTANVEVAVWKEPGGIRAVAAAMPRETVMAVATECRAKATMTGP